MAYYTVSMQTTSTTTTQYATMATFKASTAQRPVIKSIKIFTDSANTTAGGIGLAVSTALTTATITNGGTPIAHEPNETAAGSSVIVSTTGTMATNGGVSTIFERFTHGGSGGSGIILGIPELGGFLTALGSTAARGELCFVNLKAATPAIYHITLTFTE